MNDTYRRELKALINQLNAEADRLESECNDVTIERYLERQRRITSIELKKMSTKRRLAGTLPEGINNLKPIPKQYAHEE